MFKNIFYHRKRNKIYLWEIFNGKISKLEEDYEHVFYMKGSEKSKFKDIYGNNVIERRVKRSSDLKIYRESNHQLFESDLNEECKFLQQRYGDVDLKPDINDFHIGFADIEIESGNFFPKPEDANYEINLITIVSSKLGNFTWGNRPYTGNDKTVENYFYIKEEKERLEHFIKWFRKSKIEIISGWNLIEFDIQYIMNRLEKLNIKTSLSTINQVNSGYHEKRDPYTKKMVKKYFCKIAGVSLIDYLQLYKKFMYNIANLESYSLQFVSNYEKIGGKIELDGHINNAYKKDWNKFVEYNVQDSLLVQKLEEKKKFIELSIKLCSEALIPLEKVFSSISVIEGYILRTLHKDNVVIPDKKKQEVDKWRELGLFKKRETLQNVEWEKGTKTFEPFKVKGGHVEAKPGFYNNLLSFDFTSLYPHNIMQYNVSPETKVFNPSEKEIKEKNYIRSPLNGIYYKREQGVLPKVVSKIFEERKEFKKKKFQAEKKGNENLEQYFDEQQMIRKILINSIFGASNNPHFHFYDVDNSRVITRGGRALIRYTSRCINMYFKEHWHKIANNHFPYCGDIEPIQQDIVKLIDTDSVFLCLDEIKEKTDPVGSFDEFSEILEEKILNPFFDKVLTSWAKKYNAKQIHNFKREKVIPKQIILAKKKYLTLVSKNEETTYEEPELLVTGVEIKRSDTPKFCRVVIENTVKLLFKGDKPDKEAVIKHLKKIKKDFINQRIEEISYNKSVSNYTKYEPKNLYSESKKEFGVFKKGTPIHARAAINYNMIVERENLPYMKVVDGTKVKYLHVKDKNLLGTNVVGYIGNYPKEFNKFFEIDYDYQFHKSFLEVVQRIFDVLAWGKIQLNESKLKGFLE